MTIWELRFTDGRGASFYTPTDVTAGLGKVGESQAITVAALVFERDALADARRCIEEGNTLELYAHMGAIAFALQHNL